MNTSLEPIDSGIAHCLRWSATLALLMAPLCASAAPSETSEEQKPRNTIAVFRVDGPVTEVPAEETFPFLTAPGISLKDLVERLFKAAADANVKAVVLVPESAFLGTAQVEELRAAIAEVRSYGKDVYVYADSLMLGQYVLACGASRISIVPTGPIFIPGLHSSSMHVRGLLDKLGVKPDFVTEGAYKSAAELFMREQPSPEADAMMNWILDSSYTTLKQLIAKGRKVDEAKVQEWLDNGLFSSEQAKNSGLIDAVEHHAEFESMLKQKYGDDVIFARNYGRKTQPEIDLSSPLAFFKIWGELLRSPQKNTGGKPAVGVVYANGPIMTGKSGAIPLGGNMGAFSTEIREALDKAASDSSVKAVVLRVDSPGGSATASEIILDATRRLKSKKPLVVSMGDVAGSGGYYVACAADTIFADATTLTGSIGVLGGKLATTEMWKKIGVTFKEYKRGQNAGILSTDDVFTESERSRMRSFMDEAYALFKKHVTDIRGDRLKKPIDELAGGRVYTGRQALELGLVDKLGTMNDAVVYAAAQAKVKSYDVRVIPEPKPFLEQLIQQLSGGKDEVSRMGIAAADRSLLKLALPYLQDLDPARAAAVISVLTRLEILQQEGVVLSMPEILTR